MDENIDAIVGNPPCKGEIEDVSEGIEIKKLIEIHLNIFGNYWRKSDGGSIYSSLMVILHDARLLTNRNVTSGGGKANEVGNSMFEKPDNWVGTIAYMVVIDQLGSAYGERKKNRERWQDVLVKFGGLTSAEAKILYSLLSYSHLNFVSKKKFFLKVKWVITCHQTTL